MLTCLVLCLRFTSSQSHNLRSTKPSLIHVREIANVRPWQTSQKTGTEMKNTNQLSFHKYKDHNH